MCRYFLFGGSWYYPKGGFLDLLMTSNSIDQLEFAAIKLECLDLRDRNGFEWWHVVDMQESKIVLISSSYDQFNSCFPADVKVSKG